MNENTVIISSECKNLYEQYYTMVYRLSLMMLKNTQDAEDAAQTIFLKVIEKQPAFADEDHTRAWLITVTRNYCRDVARSFWHRKRTDMEQLPEQAIEPFDRQESLLFEIFQTLPKKQREVVYLYYFEDYSIKEIAKLLERNESTVQSQLFAARKRMKKQFSVSKSAALILCLGFALGFGSIAADASSAGKTAAVIREISEKVQASIHEMLSDEEKQLANETVSLPIQVYAADLVGINEDYVIFANERGLLIYSRNTSKIAAAIDLQAIGCNYLNANSIATRIFMNGNQLYLFNETILNGKENDENKITLPEFAYIYDLSSLPDTSVSPDAGINDNSQNLNIDSTFNKITDNTNNLTYITDKTEIKKIQKLWNDHSRNYMKDTFHFFYGADFLDQDNEKYNQMHYSRNSLIWTDKSGENMLSCLVVYDYSDYELYTKRADGSVISQKLNLAFTNEYSNNTDPSDNTSPSDDPVNEVLDALPSFSYTGDDPVLAAICSYMMSSDDRYYSISESSVYIPAPVIFDVKKDGDDLIVFCNLYEYNYYRNGNTLECESGGESPARLRLHPDTDAPGAYEVTEDLRTGDGSEYEKGIKEFCKGYPGMADQYFNHDKSAVDARESIRKTLIRMYVQNNGLDIKYYKDYGWDPVPLNE